eukprot:CAMPEP_0172448990 /NCGR_PEP_ID=MMETSP1065-20121228/7841_1 /TAXON_ID=265537 /ORGANISM="Amphiprora paludosa, Strain CCMP125" /LENGTH=741 /DNA_ID=CAMNT_0013200589 /DNA_START=140 /DNA_END=2365 /DNA_ORIENTATION=-
MILDKRLSWALLSVGLAATLSEGSLPGAGSAPGYGGGYNNYNNNYDPRWQQQQQGQFGRVETEPQQPPQAVAKEEPRPLLPGWVEYFDQASGQPYYHNANDGTTTWERPVAEAAEVSVGVEEPASEANATDVVAVPETGEVVTEEPIATETSSVGEIPENTPPDFSAPQPQQGQAQEDQPTDEVVLTSHQVDNGASASPVDSSIPQKTGPSPDGTDNGPGPETPFQQQQPGAWGMPEQQQMPSQGRGWGVGQGNVPQSDQGPPESDVVANHQMPGNPQAGEGWRASPGMAQDSHVSQPPKVENEPAGSSPPAGSWQAGRPIQSGPEPGNRPVHPGAGMPQQTGLPSNPGRPGMPHLGSQPIPQNPQQGLPSSSNQQPPPQFAQQERPPQTGGQQVPSRGYQGGPPQGQTRPLNPPPRDSQSAHPGNYMPPPNQPYMQQRNPNAPPGPNRPPQYQNPYNQYGQYNQYGNYGGQGNYGQPPQNSNSLVSQETSSAVRGAIGSAWQGILGFGNRTKDAVETARSSVVETAKGAGQQISSTSTNIWGQAKNTIGSLFEPGPDAQSPYSLSGGPGGPPQGNPNQPGQYQQHQPGYPYNPNQPGAPGMNGPPGYPQRLPPQQQQGGRNGPPFPNQQGQPPQGQRQGPPQTRPSPNNPYPPGYRPPQPRGDSPYGKNMNPGQGSQQQQQHQQPPPQQAQWGAPPNNPGWQGPRNPPPGQQQQQRPQPNQKDPRETNNAWDHPALNPEF